MPKIGDRERGARGLEAWAERSAKIEDQDLAGLARGLPRHPACRGLLEAVFSNSPFLTHCILSDMGFFIDFLTRGPDAVQAEVLQGVKQDLHAELDQARLMSGLRTSRRRTALVVALADLTRTWDLNATVEALSDFADAAVSAAVAHLLRQAGEGAEVTLPDPENPEHDCGFTVLALGKLGARELNYSSDIDLIVLHDPEKSPPRAGRSPQEGFVRMTRSLVRILEERTAEGYVFRIDLRLRPDPGAMPLAISMTAALTYYESLGQNWERAAMIKARPIAGDLRMGARFLAELRPFIWRKNLDFWAIQDIHSIKRQIYAHKGGAEIAIEGHDIKLGRGGIREIEFFAQTQQLIWGGREPLLRCANTQDALAVLAAAGHVSAEAAATLGSAYRFLRRLEHRLQMVDDRQTQRLPEDRSGVARIAAFMSYADSDRFRVELLGHLRAVEDHYAALFEEALALATFGNLVFTGGDPEPGTLKTLTEMGFEEGATVFNLVRAWHHGRYRATRSTRSRQLLTELMPTLLQALAKTTQPDQALTKFDEFLAGLPAGVQLFSMLYANPTLMDLLAEIMGGAPALADHLSRNAELLEAVLASNFFEPIPAQPALAQQLALALAQARDFQDALDIARRWANDRRFQVGVHILRHASDVDESGRA
ncbi:MAG: bifunctional [glutamine synthetase] adenylyltransferase/[glutamine synthetase]-adenylyl-L-tyrosine phosphorylase, partial [Kiloniellales bacterium]